LGAGPRFRCWADQAAGDLKNSGEKVKDARRLVGVKARRAAEPTPGKKLEMPSHPRSPYMAPQLMDILHPLAGGVARVAGQAPAHREHVVKSWRCVLRSPGYWDERPVAAFGVHRQVMGPGTS
jgi:hypothetical protein